MAQKKSLFRGWYWVPSLYNKGNTNYTKGKHMTYEPDPSDYVKAEKEDAAIQDAAERYAKAGNPLPELAAIMDIAFGITR
jgi:hypothetical protein